MYVHGQTLPTYANIASITVSSLLTWQAQTLRWSGFQIKIIDAWRTPIRSVLFTIFSSTGIAVFALAFILNANWSLISIHRMFQMETGITRVAGLTSRVFTVFSDDSLTVWTLTFELNANTKIVVEELPGVTLFAWNFVVFFVKRLVI